MPSWSSAYVEQHMLTAGHSDTINYLTFSPDGRYLASCGDDNSLIIWNVEEGRLLYRLLFKSPVDCAIWHPIYPGTLIVGCDNGYLFQLHEFSPRNSEQFQIELGVRNTVRCMDYDKHNRLLAVGIGMEVYVIREVKQNYYEGASLFPAPPYAEEQGTERENRLRPVGVHFLKEGEQLLGSYIVHGIVCWNTSNQSILWNFLPDAASPYIGSSALSPNGEEIAVYNVLNGIQVYSVGRRRKLKHHFKLTKTPRTKHSTHITYINEGRGIICGTTTGDASVWDTNTREMYQALIHDRDDILQAITGTNRAGYSYIATGSTDKGQLTYIKIWRAKYTPLHPTPQVAFSGKVTNVVRVESGRVTRIRLFFMKYFLPIGVVVSSFLVLSSLSQSLPWSKIQNAFVTLTMAFVKTILIGYDYFAAILYVTCHTVHELVFSAVDIVFEHIRMRMLLWLRLDELLVPRLPPPHAI